MNSEWLQLDQVADCVQFNQVTEKNLLIYAITDLHADVLVQWGKHVIPHLTKDNPPPLYRVLYDLSHPSVSMAYLVLTGRNMFNIGITPRGRFLMDNFFKAHPDVRISLGLVLSDAASGRIAARHQVTPFHDSVTGKIFFEREAALERRRLELMTSGLTASAANTGSEALALPPDLDIAEADSEALKQNATAMPLQKFTIFRLRALAPASWSLRCAAPPIRAAAAVRVMAMVVISLQAKPLTVVLFSGPTKI